MKGHGTVLEPLDIQLHVNPVSLAVGAVGGLFAIGLGWLAWNGIQSGFGTIVPGLNQSDYWNGVVAKVTKGKAGGGKGGGGGGGGGGGSGAADAICTGPKNEYAFFETLGQGVAAAAILASAKAKGCAWAQ